ncbi:hypothetical protein [Vibrio diazotrophicus]|uniref:hypothetical protein n=1 Tax=Vibrio diazotrophicus TaxID=685 RepID=UPI0011AF9D05|nr:hypothetical protein [Vibrio diazotrophicus]
MKQTIASSRRIWSRTTFNIKEATPKNSTNTLLKVNGLGRFSHLIESATGEILEITGLSGVKLEPQNRNKTALLIFQLTIS